jgi:hypothetical protein
MKTPTTINLDKLKVEIIEKGDDVDDLQYILEESHPLGRKKTIGKRMLYAVSYYGTWVAVLIYDTCVDRNKLREEKIGWNSDIRIERRKYIANNSRFAIVEKFNNIPNLASKVLSLIEDRISKDWERKYKFPLLALETYVDPEHNENKGSCYKATGWELLGNSTGFQEKGKNRTHSKLYFLKPLVANSYKMLSTTISHAVISGDKSIHASDNKFLLPSELIDISSLRIAFKSVKDPRTSNVKYKLDVLLSFCVAAMFLGKAQFRQMADFIKSIPKDYRVKHGLPYRTTPHESTIGDIFAMLDVEEIRAIAFTWAKQKGLTTEKITKIFADGKELRATGNSILNVIGNGKFAIAQSETKKGAGEIATLENYISKLPQEQIDEDCVLIADAMQTNQKIMDICKKKKIKIIFLVKKNQRNLYKRVNELFEKNPNKIIHTTDTDAAHGRVEVRRV